MILDAFMSKFSALFVQLVREEVGLLLGAPGEIEKLEQTVHDIKFFLTDAEQRQAERDDIKYWLMKLKDIMYDADDIMDLCQIKAEERLDRSDSPSSSQTGCVFLHLLSCFRNPLFAHKIGTKIKEINLRLKEIRKWMDDLHLRPLPVCQVDSFISRNTDHLVVNTVGEKIEEDAGLLVRWLTEEENVVKGEVGVLAIVGMGGIGKTTLAKRIFNDHKIKEEFQLKIWACVSKKVKAVELLTGIIRKAEAEPGAAQERWELVPKLEEAVKGKKFFLVLDDIWPGSLEVWEDLLQAPMSSGAHGSMLLVTTRDEKVANAIRATKSHRVEKMCDEDGWSLLIKQVFRSEEESEIQVFKDIGLKLLKKCGGLPLAIKSIGGLLCMKSKTIGEWEALLRSNVWSMDERPNGIHQALRLSYEDISSPLKQCFIFCSLFPEDYMFPKTDLIYLWFAEGFLQCTKDPSRDPWELGIEFYNELLIRNLLEDSGRKYDKSESKMHDLWRSYAHYLGKEENFILTEEKVLNRSRPVKLRRLSIEGTELNLKVVKKEKGLRTLLIDNIPENALANLCTTLPNLRILDMSVSSISTLPNSLSSLVHLRYLDVSKTKVRTIPKSIGCLRNLIYLDFMSCNELRHVPPTITNLEKLMFLSFQGTKIEGIPTGLKNLEKLKELYGFRSNKNSLEMFSTLDELKTLSHLVHLQLDCLERVTDKNKAKEAKLSCKKWLQGLYLEYTELSGENQASQTNEKKMTTEAILNELCPPDSLEILKIEGYIGSCLPNWLNLGTNLSKLRFLEIRNCNCIENLGPLGHLTNLDFLRIKGACSIVTVGEEFLSGDIKSRDMVTKSGTIISAFPKLNKLIFEDMPSWKEWQWNKVESAMPKLKQLYIKGCSLLRCLPEGLIHHATSLEYLEIDGADNLTIVENFLSINDIRVFRNPNLGRISNLPCVSYLLIEDCPNLKTVQNLNALQWMELVDFEMDVLPEYLETVKPSKLTIDCNEGLRQKITSDGESGPEWHKFKHIPKTPFSFTTNITT